MARTWLQLRGAQRIIATLQTQIDSAQQTFELTDNRQKGGLSPQLDVENARARVSATLKRSFRNTGVRRNVRR